MSSLPQFNPARIRSYILRLPFCTKILVAAILGLWVATIPFPWIRDFGGLEPNKMDLTQSTCFCWFLGKEGEYGVCPRPLRMLGIWAQGHGVDGKGRRKIHVVEYYLTFISSSTQTMLIYHVYSAPTQPVPSVTLGLLSHDFQPLRRNTTYRAFRV